MEYGSGNSDCSPGHTPLALTVPGTHQPSPLGVSTQDSGPGPRSEIELSNF